MKIDWSEELDGGLRYTETTEGAEEAFYPFLRLGWANNKKPARLCQLWQGDAAKPLSYLTLFSYESRIGEAVIPVEGIGGVATTPAFRRRGHASRLLERAIERASKRVDLLLLNGIRGFYGAAGFVPCLHKCEMLLRVRAGESARELPGAVVRDLEPGDLAAICDLANRARRTHTGTTVRTCENFAGPRPASDWDPGEQGFVIERDGRVAGYAIYSRTSFGGVQPYAVLELVGADAATTEALVREVARIGLERRLEVITFHEVPDSFTGGVLRRLGCEARIQYDVDAGWMGRILCRDEFVRAIASELTWRARRDDAAAIDALASSELVEDDGRLLQLVTGYVPWDDVAASGDVDRAGRKPRTRARETPGERFDATARSWFPGTSLPERPLAYAYRLDWF